jgi:MGT family glycosyltransferase
MSTAPKTILLAPASTVLFHVGRCLGIAEELSRRGHRVICVGARRYLQDPAIARGHGYEYHELPDFDSEQAMEILRNIARAPSRRLIKTMLEAELKLLRELQPDVAVVDFRLTMYLSARALGVPVVSLLLGLWLQQYSAVQPTIIQTYAHSRWLKRLIGSKGLGLLTPTILRLIVRYKTLPFTRLAREYGLPPRKFLWDLLVGELNLLLDTDAWSPTKPLPPSFHRIGPILWEPSLPLPPWVGDLDKERPVVYINFGSTAHRDLFRQVFADFADSSYQVIVSTGGQIDPQDFHIPANFYVEKFLPVGRVMELADLVIYHGGAGTAYQVMKAGLPSIVIATHLDQEYQGMATEAHRVGVFLTMRDVLAQPRLLHNTTESMLGSLAKYRANARILHDDLQRYNSRAAAADLIEGLAALQRDRL